MGLIKKGNKRCERVEGEGLWKGIGWERWSGKGKEEDEQKEERKKGW